MLRAIELSPALPHWRVLADAAAKLLAMSEDDAKAGSPRAAAPRASRSPAQWEPDDEPRPAEASAMMLWGLVSPMLVCIVDRFRRVNEDIPLLKKSLSSMRTRRPNDSLNAKIVENKATREIGIEANALKQSSALQDSERDADREEMLVPEAQSTPGRADDLLDTEHRHVPSEEKMVHKSHMPDFEADTGLASDSVPESDTGASSVETPCAAAQQEDPEIHAADHPAQDLAKGPSLTFSNPNSPSSSSIPNDQVVSAYDSPTGLCHEPADVDVHELHSPAVNQLGTIARQLDQPSNSSSKQPRKKLGNTSLVPKSVVILRRGDQAGPMVGKDALDALEASLGPRSSTKPEGGMKSRVEQGPGPCSASSTHADPSVQEHTSASYSSAGQCAVIQRDFPTELPSKPCTEPSVEPHKEVQRSKTPQDPHSKPCTEPPVQSRPYSQRTKTPQDQQEAQQVVEIHGVIRPTYPDVGTVVRPGARAWKPSLRGLRPPPGSLAASIDSEAILPAASLPSESAKVVAAGKVTVGRGNQAKRSFYNVKDAVSSDS